MIPALFRHPRAVPGRRRSVALAVAALLAAAGPARAAVYNIHLNSDSNPDYTTRESFLATTLPVWSDPQDQAIALWRWGVRNRRQTHATYEEGRGLFDPILFFNSYANTYCGFIAGMQEALVDGIGGPWQARYLELADHTVMEASWDAGATWHMFDASMNIYCFNNQGAVASALEIAEPNVSELALQLGETGPVAGHHYLYNFALECGSNPVHPGHAGDLGYPWGYRIAVEQPVPFSRTLRNGADSYISGIQIQENFTHVRTGHRYRLNLRRHEHYTRHWHHLGETEAYCRPTTHTIDPDDISVAGDMRGNGRWVLAPDLTTTAYRLAIYDEAGTVHRSEDGGAGPAVHPAAAGAAGTLTFKVYGANVVTSGSLVLQGYRATAADALSVSVSRNAGITWQEIWSASGTGAIAAEIPLSAAAVGGTWEYLCRVTMSAAGDRTACGVDDVALTTITQVNRLALPRLQRGANRVSLRLGEQQESHMLWPALHAPAGTPLFEETAESHENVYAASSSLQFSSAVLRPVLGGVPAQVTWRLTTPTPITGLRYGGSVLVRTPGPADRVDLQHSFDGATFTPGASFFGVGSRTWDRSLYAETDDVPADARTVWLRYQFLCAHDQDYTSTGVQDALMYVDYAPRDPTALPVEVTYCWTEHRAEGDVERRHTQLVSGADATWQINVGGYRDPTMNWVRVNLQGYGPDGPGPYGYHDGIDVGPGAGYDKQRYVFQWQDNVALGRPYTVSRAASASNPDTDGTELTNGCIVPPTTYTTSWAVQEQTAFWAGDAPVEVTIDLEQERSVAGLRITTHQPDAAFCHPESVAIAVAGESGGFRPLGTIRHDRIWSPPGDFLGHEHDASPDYADLPAGGRLAYAFWEIPETPATARYLRCTFQPQAGRGVGISEIQALSRVETRDWPDREVFMSGVAAVGPGRDDAGSRDAVGPAEAGTLLAASPNPFNARLTLRFTVPAAGPVRIDVYDVAGRHVRRLYERAWREAGAGSVSWDGCDGGGRPVASGVYLCRLQAGPHSDEQRVVMVK